MPWTASPAVRWASEPSARRTSWSASSNVPSDTAVVVVAVAVGQVLLERAAARDVHHLHAAADAEQRQVALERAARQGELERVALGHEPLRLRVGLGPVGRGVDVGTAGEHQAVEQVERLVGLLEEHRVGREDDAAGHRPAAPPRRTSGR